MEISKKMKLKSLLMLLLAGMLASCASPRSGEVSYTLGRNYYSTDEAPVQHAFKITSATEFERCFNMSPVMGTNGEPTPVNFKKQFVIAKVWPVTDRAFTAEPVSLIFTSDNKLLLRYRETVGERRSFSIKPMFFLVVDKKYARFPLLEEKL